jgi:hypothetical protein
MVLDIDFIAYRGSQMPKDCSDGKVGVASITQRGRQVVAEVVVAYILVTRLALKISSGDARRGCWRSQGGVMISWVWEGRKLLTVSHLPPDSISVILFAMLGFSATHSTFILVPHILLL